MQFQSVPAGANVQTAQGQTCSTPCSLAVPVTAPGGFVQPEWLRADKRLSSPSTKPKDLGSVPRRRTLSPIRLLLRFRCSAPARPRARRSRGRAQTVARPRPAAPRPASMQGPTEPSIAAPEQAAPQDNVFPLRHQHRHRHSRHRRRHDNAGKRGERGAFGKNSGRSGLYPAHWADYLLRHG